MKEFIKNNKAVCAGIAVALVAVIVVAVVLVAGRSNPPVNTPTGPGQLNSQPTQGTTQPSKPNGNDATVPTGSTEPSINPTSPTDPSANATEPTTGITIPPATEQDPTEPQLNPNDKLPTEPTQPKPTEPKPTEPKPTEPKPTEPKPTEPKPTNPTYDFPKEIMDVKPEDYNSWSFEKQQAWVHSLPPESERTLEETHHIDLVVLYNGYTCGTEGHACTSQIAHNGLMEYLAIPCAHCGADNQNCHLYFDERGWSKVDMKKCPQYNEKLDDRVYCQDCGLKWRGANADPTKTCSISISGKDCKVCGQHREPGKCHTCKQEDIDAFNKK